MAELTYNTHRAFRQRIDPLIGAVLQQIAQALRRGKPTATLDKKLSRLWLLRQGSAHFSPEQIAQAFTYVNLTARV